MMLPESFFGHGRCSKYGKKVQRRRRLREGNDGGRNKMEQLVGQLIGQIRGQLIGQRMDQTMGQVVAIGMLGRSAVLG
jgi:hypothetical protein